MYIYRDNMNILFLCFRVVYMYEGMFEPEPSAQARRHPRPPAAKHRGAELCLGAGKRRGGLLHRAGAHASCALINVESSVE